MIRVTLRNILQARNGIASRQVGFISELKIAYLPKLLAKANPSKVKPQEGIE